MTDLSLFGGTGYIGSTYERMYPGNIIIPRGQRHFDTKNVLYFISTTTNQNIFQDLQVDIDVNLKIFTEFLSQDVVRHPLVRKIIDAYQAFEEKIAK